MTTRADRRADTSAPAPLSEPIAAWALRQSSQLRGPNPPAAVCPHCGATVLATYDHPILVDLKRRGLYAGETSGGLVTCAECERDYQTRQRARVRSGGAVVLDLPKPLERARLDYLEGQRGAAGALSAAREWLERPDHDLYLFGPTGVGKSGIAAALAREVLERELVAGVVVFVDARTLIRRLKAAMGDDARQADALGRVETYERAGLLVLDDLGAEYGTAYTRTTLEGLYAARLDAGWPTIITSNLPLAMTREERAKAPAARRYRQTLGEFLEDDRMVSRIAGNAAIVELLGDDQRLSGWEPRRRQ
jgi:DNA replication protein DnaC